MLLFDNVLFVTHWKGSAIVRLSNPNAVVCICSFLSAVCQCNYENTDNAWPIETWFIICFLAEVQDNSGSVPSHVTPMVSANSLVHGVMCT